MYSDMCKSQAFLKCLWVNALKQLTHGPTHAVCKIKHLVHGLSANNIASGICSHTLTITYSENS